MGLPEPMEALHKNRDSIWESVDPICVSVVHGPRIHAVCMAPMGRAGRNLTLGPVPLISA